MVSLQLTLLLIVVAFYSTFGGPIVDDQGLKPCPKIKPYTNVNTDQVKTIGKSFTNDNHLYLNLYYLLVVGEMVFGNYGYRITK